MSILLGVIVLFALLSGVVAVLQAVAISRLAPADGPAWRGWLFGWWRFQSVATRAGLAGEDAAAIYKRAVLACLAFVILGLILSSWAVNERKSETTADAAPDTFINGRAMPATQSADNSMLRIEALTPGVALLES